MDHFVAMQTLEDMGSADAIADYLLSGGWKGKVCGGNSCPVAVYLNDVCNEGTYFVGIAEYGKWLGDSLQWEGRYLLPKVVIKFTRMFDNEEYPDLIAAVGADD